VEHRAADQLHIEMAHPECSLGDFADQCERFRQYFLKQLAISQALAKFGRLRFDLFIGHRLDLSFQ
jgi:hypothetical protein